MRWKLDPNGLLNALDEQKSGKAIDFVKSRQSDIVQLVAYSWCLFLFMVFTLIVTVRFAYAF